MFFRSSDTITAIPRTTGTKVRGRYVEAAGTSRVLADASCQPANNNEVQALPEGRRNDTALRLYTSENLNSLLQDQNPDHITIGSVQYEIYSKNIWNNGLIPHYKYIITEVV